MAAGCGAARASPFWALPQSQHTSARFTGFQASTLVGARVELARAGRQPPAARACLTRCAAPVAASAIAQPLLRTVGRLVARALGSGVLLKLARGTRSALAGRAGPFVFAGLIAYSVAVTLFAAQANSRASTAAASASVSSADVEATATAADVEPAAPESFAEAVAASAVAELPAPSYAVTYRKPEPARGVTADSTDYAAPRQAAKKESRVNCKVCGGTGQVKYENHMAEYDGTVCPCCLGKGKVRSNNRDLISCLLTFDP